MPYLRFSRDGRGYDNTYVLDTVHEGGKARPRMLYWSRTPPNIGVGRPPLDEDAIRALEENNPGLVFEWDKILAARAAAQAEHNHQGYGASKPQGRRKRGRQVDQTGKRQQEKPRGASSGESGRPSGAELPVVSETTDAPPREVEPSDVALPSGSAVVHSPDSQAADAPGFGGQPSSAGESQHPVVTLMGDDVLERLRRRYAELQVRMGDLPPDLADRESIQARAATLDPDGWGGLEAALTGIERFESDVAEVERRVQLALSGRD